MTRRADMLTELPRFVASSGELSFMQVGDHIPFAIDQVSWIDAVAGGVVPGDDIAAGSGSAVVALSGGFDVALEGHPVRHVHLERTDRSLHVPAGQPWSLRDLSRGAIALIASAAPAGAAGSHDRARTAITTADVEAGSATVGDCTIVQLPTAETPAGSCITLRFAPGSDVQARRIYYLTNLRAGSSRGSHAHRTLHQFVVAAKGTFKVRIDDGRRKQTLTLTRPDRALHLVPGIWRVLHSFSAGAICLVVASRPYDEDDYVRQYADFVALKDR